MNVAPNPRNDRLVENLIDTLGRESVITDPEERKFYSADVYAAGKTCAVAVKPKDREAVTRAVAAATRSGYAVIGRGGGMSYTRGYSPVREDTVMLDIGALNRIVEFNANDMYITVETGVTWKQIYDALRPKGLRIPMFGTFSGMRATVGGGLSQGALFMGTARYGQAADNVLGLEVVLADGSVVKTGQAAFRNGKPVYRTYGPDLTGLFLHDGGALGIKTLATFKLMQVPKESGYASFVFPGGILAAVAALSDVARSGAAEDAYVFDPESTDRSLATPDAVQDMKTLVGVVTGQSSWLKGMVEGTKLVLAGRSFSKESMFSLHVVCGGRSSGAVDGDLAIIRQIAAKHKGEEIANSIPKAIRGDPFKPLNGVLGPNGDRWAAMNAKVAHSQAATLIAAANALFDSYKARMDKHGVTVTRLMIAIDTYSYSFEPVLHWYDSWLPVHRRTPEPAYLKKLTEPKPNPEAAALVEEIRLKIAALFAEHGGASNQIGKTYPYLDNLNANTAKLLRAIKAHVDPDGQFNPGVLGFGK
ncbi:MAG: FAD-binding oxidoreductase [Alphaproteobacteria bacterium]|nr:FAD-binding oxidoreductase [Alphaproteobacteria bacterium]